MQHGANAREGVYPHRDATTAHAIAAQRGYDEIVRIIEEEEEDGEQKRRDAPERRGGNARRRTPLHVAAESYNADLVRSLLAHGADVNARSHENHTPLDRAARRWYQADTQLMTTTARVLLDGGAQMTGAAAAALGDEQWIRARHAGGTLTNEIDPAGGMLRIAVTHNRPEILKLLLDFGFDP